jgi:hypothetical protein
VRFWDTSGVVPLLLEQEATAVVVELLAADPGMVVWWGTPVEGTSAGRAGIMHRNAAARCMPRRRTCGSGDWAVRPPGYSPAGRSGRSIRTRPDSITLPVAGPPRYVVRNRTTASTSGAYHQV